MPDCGLIIMPCRNALAYSRPCLKSLQAQTVPVDILVVNNASTDGTTDWLRAEQVKDKRLYAMSFPDVRSVAECWNRGLRWGWQRGHGEALVVNNDTELMPDTPWHLWNYLDCHGGQKIGMLTCISVRSREEMTIPEKFSPRPHPDFSCFMIERWAHQAVPFDEAYQGAYLEDCRMHVEMHRRGIQAIGIDLPFLHHASGTLKDAGPEEVRRIQECAKANRERFNAMYGCLPGTKDYERLFA